ncbi:MAG TPA: alkaline phosphatase family protein, partial [Thermoplasmata archaeon]|nr:alkaline phosphatase family protein [Thermoplasmata archaeon]
MAHLRGPVLAAACLFVVGLLIGLPADARPVSVGSAPAFGPSSTHLKHVVIIMMENHAFDNFFGTYCPVKGPYCKTPVRGEPAKLCVPINPARPSGPCVNPYSLGVAGMYTHDLTHDWNSTHKAINNGAMNGFYYAESSKDLPFGYFNGSTIPLEWDLAEEYGLGDNFFSSTTSYSLPNHWFLVAGQTPVNSENLSYPGNGHQTPTYRHAYLNSSNTTRSVEDLLNASPSVSWRYYDWALPAYTTSISGGWGNLGAYNYWNPLAGAAESYTPAHSKHFVNRTSFFADAAAGSLPDISWLIPGAAFSDHPQLGNLSTGEAFLSQAV